jgi:hypothetical protein
MDDQVTGKESENSERCFKDFLESTHPSVSFPISDLFAKSNLSVVNWKLNTIDLRLHCTECEGIRTFRHVSGGPTITEESGNFHLRYLCGDCRHQEKRFALYVTWDKGQHSGSAYKYGELPPFGIPVPNQLLRLFGRDSKLFLKGRQCENQGLGIAAFAYYRRVVETHKNDIFDAIIRICETLGTDETLVAQLQTAKGEISFSKSMDLIKAALPQGMLINGHNPLSLLHSALSVGLHAETDEQCLETAQAVRVVLSDMVEKMNTLRQDDVGLKQAVALLAAKAGAGKAV